MTNSIAVVPATTKIIRSFTPPAPPTTFASGANNRGHRVPIRYEPSEPDDEPPKLPDELLLSPSGAGCGTVLLLVGAALVVGTLVGWFLSRG